jgi:fused signal recognition particle receptor
VSLLERFRASLARTRETFTARLEHALRQPPGPEFYEALEAALIESDVGVAVTAHLVDALRERREKDPAALRAALRGLMRGLVGDPAPLRLDASPAAVLVLGVNGTGKTTSIAKLAHRLRGEGRSVLLAAADTFRAAAIDQLVTWGRRVGAEVVSHAPGADPAAVVFDAAQAVRARGIDVLIVDTAGRLHTKVNLMEELKKINRVLSRELPQAPVERLLVLDASTGQNAIQQARLFHEAVTVTGLILAKLDGSAKGGAVLAIGKELGLPVKLVGTGEGLDDLAPFDPVAYVDALLPDLTPADR